MTGKPLLTERQDESAGILPVLDSRNAKRRHRSCERFIVLFLFRQHLPIGRAKHGEIGNRIDKQAFGPCRRLRIERTKQPSIGALLDK